MSGGEPTIHPRLVEFIKYGRKLGYEKIQIVSNGRMLGYSRFTKALKKAGLDETTFSIHGHTRELHEGHTRVPGSFSQIVSGIRNALKEGFIVNTDTVITKMNYSQLPDIINFVHRLGVTEMNLMSMVPVGNAWNNRNAVFYDFEKVTPFVRKVIKYCESNNIVLWLSRYPAKYLEGHEKYIESYKKIAEDVIAIGEDHFRDPPCKGLKCEYCGVSNVCSDIEKALNYTKSRDAKVLDFLDIFSENPQASISEELHGIIRKLQKDKSLSVLGVPPCTLPPKLWERACNPPLLKGNSSDFEKLVDEICKRDMIKNKSCEKCTMFHDCPGIYREYARTFGFGELAPLSCREIRITLDCNMNCQFCNTGKESENVIVDLPDIYSKLEIWANKEIDHLIISGGEPTMHPMLHELIKNAKKNIKRVDIQTNALKLADPSFVSRLRENGLDGAFVSFHSHDPQVFEKLTKGDMKEACKGIKNLIAEGILTSINIVVNEMNYRQLTSTVKYINKEFSGITSISFSYVCPVNRAMKNKWVIPKISDAVPHMMKALEKTRELGIKANVVARSGIPACMLPGYEEFFESVGEIRQDDKDKIKKDECSSCERNSRCDGFWKEYVNIHGFT